MREFDDALAQMHRNGVGVGDIAYYAGAGVALREVRMIQRGVVFAQHRHDYDHLSYLARGEVLLATSDHENPEPMDPTAWEVMVLAAPCAVEVKAHLWHMVQSRTDDVVWCCIHPDTE